VKERVDTCIAGFQFWMESKPTGSVTIGYGAAAKGVTLLSAARIKPGEIDLIIDNSKEKTGKYFAGLGIPIISESEFLKKNYLNREMRFIVFPWNIAIELGSRISKFAPGSKTIVAIPSLRELNQ
jgi:hypothetical protein